MSQDSRGLCLRALDLWLDPAAPAPWAFVSHAHAAQGLASERVLASPETLALGDALREAVGARPTEAQAMGWDASVELPIRRDFGGGTAKLSLAPAGHVLGGAQLVVDHPRGRLVYAGDWSPEGDEAVAGGACVECDDLIVNATFGLPIFQFEAASAVVARLVAWCGAQLAEGVTPVVLVAPVGTAQVVSRALARAGVPLMARDEVAKGCEAYEALGVSTGVTPRDPKAGGAVVLAPARARSPSVRPRGRSVIGYASGWAALDAAVEQKRADAAFPLALTADHDGLMALANATGARHVYATRGDGGAFAHLLAQPLAGGRPRRATAIDLGPIDDRSAW